MRSTWCAKSKKFFRMDWKLLKFSGKWSILYLYRIFSERKMVWTIIIPRIIHFIMDIISILPKMLCGKVIVKVFQGFILISAGGFVLFMRFWAFLRFLSCLFQPLWAVIWRRKDGLFCSLRTYPCMVFPYGLFCSLQVSWRQKNLKERNSDLVLLFLLYRLWRLLCLQAL